MANLFSPIRISRLSVRNRIIMPALILNYPINGFDVSDEWIRFYRRRAKGGAGLIIVGACNVDQAGKMDLHQLGVDRDEWIPSLEKIARAIKDEGAVPAIQLNHAGRYARKSITGIDPVAPSAIASRYTGELPRELSSEEVEVIIRSFAAAACRARVAGFEAIELLGATGYLISQFLSPVTNRRTDRFGGTEEKRRTFVREIISGIKEAVGNDFPLIFRQSALDNVPGGMDADDQLNLAKELKAWGVHLINVTAGWHDAPINQIGPSVSHGHFIPYATRIKETVHLPVSCAVRITRPEQARLAIEENKLDLVTLGRALIADPDWPRKARIGDDEFIRQCICCCNCFDRAFAKEGIECSVNAALDDDVVEPAANPKRILVVGAGPAGIEAARILAKRGHRVTVLEKRDRLAGRLHAAAKPPYKSEINSLIRFLVNDLKSLNVPVIKEVDFNALADRYDGVILAAGAKEKTISIKGMENMPTYTCNQILDGLVTPQDPVVILGAGLVGCETADLLSREDRDVTIVELEPKPLRDMGVTLRWGLLKRLRDAGVKIYTSSSVREVREGQVVIETKDRSFAVKAGCLVQAIGFEPAQSRIVEAVRNSGLPFCVIGDQKAPRRIKDAIHEGYRAGTAWVDGLE